MDLNFNQSDSEGRTAEILVVLPAPDKMAVKPRKRNSDVWKHFVNTETGKARCEMCNKIYSYCNSSTSNLQKHLYKIHDIALGKTSNAGRPKGEPTLQHIKKVKRNNVKEEVGIADDISNLMKQPLNAHQQQKLQAAKIKEKELLNQLLLRMICVDYQLVSIVSDAGFSKLMTIFRPGCTVPTRKEISQVLLPSLYNTVSTVIGKELEDVAAICITVETWTSVSTETFIAIMCHYIDSAFCLKSATIGVEALVEHSPEVITEVIRNTVVRWKVEDKVACMVTDDDNSMKTAAANLDYRWLGCFAHMLSCTVKDGLEDAVFQLMRKKIKTIVEHLKNNPVALTRISEMQVAMNRTPLKLIAEVGTQWTTTIEMIMRYIELEAIIKNVAEEIEVGFEFPLPEDMLMVSNIIELLSPFKEATFLMSSQVKVKASEVIYIAGILHKKTCLFLLRQDVPENVLLIAQSMVTAMETCHGFQNFANDIQLAIATFLDPRMKNLGFSEESAAEEAQRLVINAAARISLPEMNERVEEAYQNPDGSITVISTVSEKGSSLWEDLDHRVASLQTQQTPSTEAELEMRKYVKDDLLKRKGDPLSWWKERQNIYPRLSRVAKEVLSILCNCVSCERMFSKMGQITTNRRASLSGRKAKMISFISSNYHFIEK